MSRKAERCYFRLSPLARAETQARLKTLGATTVGDTPEQFREFLRKDHERWARVIKAAGIKGE